MTYERNIPVGNISPADQQAQVKINFSQYPVIYSSTSGGVVYNHMPINSSNQGKHAAIILTKQTSDPVINNDFVALYNKIAASGVGNALQAFIRINQFDPDIPNDPMQLTYSTVNTAGPQYQSFLIGGYILYIGSISGTASSTANLSFPITLSPVPSGNIIPIAATNTASSRSGGFSGSVGCAICTQVTSSSTFNITMESPFPNSPATYKLTWMAIASA